MKVSMTVTIEVGKRTPINVIVTPRSVNDKTLTLPNGAETSVYVVAQWILTNLSAALDRVQPD